MYLCEEYFQRNNINCNHIRHVKQGNFIFKSKNKINNPWTVMTITFKPNEFSRNDGPNEYEIRYMRPDSNIDNAYLSNIEKPIWVQWDKYEDYLINWCKKPSFGKPINYSNARFVCWEMFLYACDFSLSKIKTKIDLFYTPLNYKLSIKKRHIAISTATEYFMKNHQDLYRAWTKSILPLTNNYCHWLFDYINYQKLA